MKKYKCHKTVEAAKIMEIRLRGAEPGLWHTVLEFGAPGLEYEIVTDEWTNKHNPATGGYFVRYEDGYTSYSPGPVFEAGYTPEDE